MTKISLTTLALLMGTSHARTIRGSPHAAPSQHQRKLQVFITAVDDNFSLTTGDQVVGNILQNDESCFGCQRFVAAYTDVSTGAVTVDALGAMVYTSADDDFSGDIAFTYNACLVDFPTVCNGATVFIEVLPDPNKPDENPTANNEDYWLYEDNELEVNANGYLGNDKQGKPSNQLFACEIDDSETENDIEIFDDGGFKYTAPRCYTGKDSFKYRACYVDYPDMESNEATVYIEVREDPNRPDQPTARDDLGKYEVWEAVELNVDSGDGLCANDDVVVPWVTRADRQSGFEGSLSVQKDGGFRYRSESGKLGTMTFIYTVCEKDWDCVTCSQATANIEVTPNPNKPATPPTPEQDRNGNTIQVKEGERYRGNVFDFVDFDDRYTLKAVDFQTLDTFVGILNTESDGSFEYGNAPVGEEPFFYEVCYREWGDLCATGSILMKTTSSSNSSSSRQGVAGLYEVHWDGADEGDCSEIKPSLTMYCADSGEINLIDAGTNDNSICSVNDIGHINCDAQNSGVVQVECRDLSSSNPARRQLITSVGSSPVFCDGFSSATTFHSVGLRAWCTDAWVDQDFASCSGETIEDANGVQTCYAEATTTGSNAKVADITMVSTVDNSCIINAGTTYPGPATPTLEIVGDNGDPSEAFPLQECQGDCDDDKDCDDGLVCMERDGSEVVPGCTGLGDASDFDKKDFCIQAPPSTEAGSSTAREDPQQLQMIGDADGKDHALYPLLECQSDCDEDKECEGDLVCFERDGLEPVPGCTGDKAEFKGEDFCVKPQS